MAIATADLTERVGKGVDWNRFFEPPGRLTEPRSVPIVGLGARAAAPERGDDLGHKANESATRLSVLIPTHEDASLLRRSLPTVMRLPHDIEGRADLQYGAYLAGVSLGSTAAAR